MKLVSLNIWGGKAYEPLMEFVKQQSKDTDVFCFQEVFSFNKGITELPSGARANIYEELKNTLGDFEGLYFLCLRSFDLAEAKVDMDVSAGQAIFIRKTIPYGNTGSFHTHREVPNLHISGFASYVEIGNKMILNLHGLHTGRGKDDEPERFVQSGMIKDFLSKAVGKEKIICGDFNMNPDIESLKILEQGMRNLNKEYHIQCTRSPLYKRFDTMKFADYILVSSDIKAKDFKVPDVAVSDHLPLILEFE